MILNISKIFHLAKYHKTLFTFLSFQTQKKIRLEVDSVSKWHTGTSHCPISFVCVMSFWLAGLDIDCSLLSLESFFSILCKTRRLTCVFRYWSYTNKRLCFSSDFHGRPRPADFAVYIHLELMRIIPMFISLLAEVFSLWHSESQAVPAR